MDLPDSIKWSTCSDLTESTSTPLIPVCKQYLAATIRQLERACPDPCTCRQPVSHATTDQSSSHSSRSRCKPCHIRHKVLVNLHGKNNPTLRHSNPSLWLSSPLEVFHVFLSPSSPRFESVEAADASAIFNFLCFNKLIPKAVKADAINARNWRNIIAHRDHDKLDFTAETLCEGLQVLLKRVAHFEASSADSLEWACKRLRETLTTATATATAQFDAQVSARRPRDLGVRIVATRVRQQQYADALLQSLVETQRLRLGLNRPLMKLEYSNNGNIGLDVTHMLVQHSRTNSQGFLLLSGDAGSGKSACVRAVAEQLVQRETQLSSSSSTAQSLTIFVDLGTLRGRMPVPSTPNHNDPDDENYQAFLTLIVTHLVEFMARSREYERLAFEDFFRQQIRSARCVFVFDSFDETPAVLSGDQGIQQLHSLSAALQALAMKHLVIVASRRFHAPQSQPTHEFELRGPCESEQRAYVDASLVVVEDLALRETLIDTLFERELLLEMRERPLLLSLTCEFITRRFESGECCVDNLLPQSPHLVLSGWCTTMLKSVECEALELEELLLVAYACGMVAQISGQQSWLLHELEADVRELLQARRWDSAACVTSIALRTLEERGVLLSVHTGAAMDYVGDAEGDDDPEHRVCFWHRRLLESFAAEYLLALPTSELPPDLLKNDAWEHVVALLLDQCARTPQSVVHSELLLWFLEQGTLRCRELIRQRGNTAHFELASDSDKQLCERLKVFLEGAPCHGESDAVESAWTRRVATLAATCLQRVRVASRNCCRSHHLELVSVHDVERDCDDDDDRDDAYGHRLVVEKDNERLMVEHCNFLLNVFSGVGRIGAPEHAVDAHERFQRAALELVVCVGRDRQGDWRFQDVLLKSAGVLCMTATKIVLSAALKNSFFRDAAIATIFHLQMVQLPEFVAEMQWKIAECVRNPDCIESRPLLCPFMWSDLYTSLYEKRVKEQNRCDNEIKRLRHQFAQVDPDIVSPNIWGAFHLLDRNGRWVFWFRFLMVVGVVFAFAWSIIDFISWPNFRQTPLVATLVLLTFPLLLAGSIPPAFRSIPIVALLSLCTWLVVFSPTFPVYRNVTFDMSSACNGTIKEWVYNPGGYCDRYFDEFLPWDGTWIQYDSSCTGGSTAQFQCCWFTPYYTVERTSSHNSTVSCEMASSDLYVGDAVSCLIVAMMFWMAVAAAFWREFMRVLIRGSHHQLMRASAVFPAALFGVLGFIVVACTCSPANKIHQHRLKDTNQSLFAPVVFSFLALGAAFAILVECTRAFGLHALLEPLVAVLGASVAVSVFASLTVFIFPPDHLDRSTFKAGGFFLRALWHQQRRWLLFGVFTTIAALSYVGFYLLRANVIASGPLTSSLASTYLRLFAVACALLGVVVSIVVCVVAGLLVHLCGVGSSRWKTMDSLCSGSLERLEKALRNPRLEVAEREVVELLAGEAQCLSSGSIESVRHWTVQYRARSDVIEECLFGLQKKMYRELLVR